MKVIYGPRRSGKTTLAIQESATTGNVIVCFNLEAKRHILQVAKTMGLEIPEPITFDNFQRGLYRGRIIPGFIIDDADKLLQSMTDIPITTITLNVDA